MKAQIELVTTFINTINKSNRNTVPYKIETTNKILATIEKNNTISIHNVYPFKEIDDSDYDYLKVVEINKTSVKFEVNNVLNNVIDKNLPRFLLNERTLKLENNMVIQLPIEQVLFVDDSFDTIQQTVSIRVVGISK